MNALALVGKNVATCLLTLFVLSVALVGTLIVGGIMWIAMDAE